MVYVVTVQGLMVGDTIHIQSAHSHAWLWYIIGRHTVSCELIGQRRYSRRHQSIELCSMLDANIAGVRDIMVGDTINIQFDHDASVVIVHYHRREHSCEITEKITWPTHYGCTMNHNRRGEPR